MQDGPNMNEQVLTTGQILNLQSGANGKIVNDGLTPGSCEIASGTLAVSEGVPANSNIPFSIMPGGGFIKNTGTPPLTIFWVNA